MELELKPLNLPSDNERPIVIAGPCSAETEEQVIETARQLAKLGCHIFRAGVWKPRTKPGGFEGNGEVALPWMQEVKKETGMLTATEVATPEHVELALKYGIDVLWVGARTTANPFAMQALADSLKGVDVPVFVKNPWFTRDIIALTMNVKGEDVPFHLEDDYFKLEKNSTQAIKKFILDKTGN